MCVVYIIICRPARRRPGVGVLVAGGGAGDGHGGPLREQQVRALHAARRTRQARRGDVRQVHEGRWVLALYLYITVGVVDGT